MKRTLTIHETEFCMLFAHLGKIINEITLLLIHSIKIISICWYWLHVLTADLCYKKCNLYKLSTEMNFCLQDNYK